MNQFNKKYIKYINDVVQQCCADLNIPRPTIKLIFNEQYPQDYCSFGGYLPASNTIKLVLKNRNLADSCRTLAHELRHAYQNHNGILNNESGKDGDSFENDANSYAGKFMRKFGRDNPEIYKLFI